MNSVQITMFVVGICVLLVVARIIWESRTAASRDDDRGMLCPVCDHEHTVEDADPMTVSDSIRRVLRLAPLPEYRCTEVSREWEATAQGNAVCDCSHPFHKPRYSLAA
jgi:hypothetical protein